MATIVNKQLNLHNTGYNFRKIAELRERARKELQPCLDERFMPARVNYDLLGEVLTAKHQMLLKKEGKLMKDFNKKSEIKKIEPTFGDMFISLIRKITKSWL